jgi:hypothetical protein
MGMTPVALGTSNLYAGASFRAQSFVGLGSYGQSGSQSYRILECFP